MLATGGGGYLNANNDDSPPLSHGNIKEMGGANSGRAFFFILEIVFFYSHS